MAEGVWPLGGGRGVDVGRVCKVLELEHALGVVLLPQQLRPRLVARAVLAAVRVAHVRHAVRRRQLRREQVPHPQHLAVELLAGREVRHDQRQVVDAVAHRFSVGGPVGPERHEVGRRRAAVLSRCQDAATCSVEH